MKTQKIKYIIISILLSTIVVIPVSFANEYINLNEISIQEKDGAESIVINGSSGSVFKKEISITNNGISNKELFIYKNEAELKKGKFSLSAKGSSESDILSWINIEKTHIDIPSKKTITLPITINFPENAGVGEHFAAILVSQQTTNADGNTTNLENGIRIYANVTGTPKTKYRIINSQITNENNTQSVYKATLINSGNTDLKGEISIVNQATNDAPSKQKINLSPGKDQKITLIVKQSSFGPERIVAHFSLNNSTKTFLLNEEFAVPSYIVIILSGISILFGLILIITRKKQLPSKNKVISTFLLLSIASGTLILSGNILYDLSLFTDTLLTQKTAYLTTIKWGNFKNTPVPDWVVTNWVGRLKLEQGEMYAIQKLHNEKNDHIYINSAKNTLNFSNTTGPDNDGIILLMKTPKDIGKDRLTIHNDLTGEDFTISLEDTVKTPRYIQYKQQQIEIKSELAPEIVNVISENGSIEVAVKDFEEITERLSPIVEIESTTEISTIKDIEASPDETTALIEEIESTFDQERLLEEVSFLKEIIEEIPASPDVLSEVVLSSDFVKEIITENQSTTVKGSSKLINRLKKTPLTIQEITGTPDMNFIFIPNEKIKLNPQTFSFSEKKTSSQELDEIIFVQKKGHPWDVYFSISDFTSVSGSYTISAQNVTVTPGAINLISQKGENTIVESGNIHKMKGNADQAVLISIIPLNNEELTFSIKPQISIDIPPNTPPGLYKAEITIRAI